MNRAPTQPYTPTQIEPNLAEPKKKKPTGYIVGMVICLILAVAGIAFGVYGILSSQQKSSEITALNTKVSDQTTKISSLETELTELKTPAIDTEPETSATIHTNPILSSTLPEFYHVIKNIPYRVDYGSTEYSVELTLRDGDIERCQLFADNAIQRTCVPPNLSGKVYKIVTAGEGQNMSDPEIAFIMQDGTVPYMHASQFTTSAAPAIEGTYDIDGAVIDTVDVAAYSEDSPTGGYGTTLFILSDGSYLSYSDLSQ